MVRPLTHNPQITNGISFELGNQIENLPESLSVNSIILRKRKFVINACLYLLLLICLSVFVIGSDEISRQKLTNLINKYIRRGLHKVTYNASEHGSNKTDY